MIVHVLQLAHLLSLSNGQFIKDICFLYQMS